MDVNGELDGPIILAVIGVVYTIILVTASMEVLGTVMLRVH